MSYTVYIRSFEDRDNITEIIFDGEQELVEYLTEQSETAFHVGNDYILTDGGFTTISVTGGIFKFLNPEEYI
jgi:hypothetical protein